LDVRFRYDERMAQGGVATLVELLEDRAGRLGDQLFMEFASGELLSFQALHSGAALYGGFLKDRGLGAGDRVALVFSTSPKLILAFFGVLYAGGIPVSMYPPPGLRGVDGYLERQARLLLDAEPRILLIPASLKPVATLLKERVPHPPKLFSWEEVERASPQTIPAPALEATQSALIQYTSGSTGRPKGVELSHAAILANCEALGGPVGFRPDDWMNNWLPLYHDMGLIGMVMFPLSYGVRTHMMSPFDFLRSPARWLRSISDGKGTITVAPNFAYSYCLRHVGSEQVPEGLDLSSWRICYHGAEPVSAGLIERFTERFAPYGFRSNVFSPVYGMAENALIATCPDHAAEPVFDRIDRCALEKEGRALPVGGAGPGTKRVVALGRAVRGTRLLIVDPKGRPLPQRHQGEILLAGTSLMKGYFRNPEAMAKVMKEGWFRTGDLGYLADGQLHVTGRRKDLIIRFGGKDHPTTWSRPPRRSRASAPVAARPSASTTRSWPARRSWWWWRARLVARTSARSSPPLSSALSATRWAAVPTSWR